MLKHLPGDSKNRTCDSRGYHCKGRVCQREEGLRESRPGSFRRDGLQGACYIRNNGCKPRTRRPRLGIFRTIQVISSEILSIKIVFMDVSGFSPTDAGLNSPGLSPSLQTSSLHLGQIELKTTIGAQSSRISFLAASRKPVLLGHF